MRAVWVTLPLTAGPAASAAIDSWADGPRVAAATLLWLAWAAGLLATLAPRPETVTALRVIAPAFVVGAILAAIDASGSTLAIAGALVATFACTLLASGTDIALAAANAAAYGDEQRFPLRTPPGLFLGPLPIARALVAGGVVAPVLLLADGDLVIGLVALVVGAALLFVLSRSLLSLARRWAVLVPAGFVVVDPLTLADPVLFLREHVRHIAPEPASAAPPEVLDLRLGASMGSVAVRFDEEVELGRAARGRHGGTTVTTQEIRVAVVRRGEMLQLAARRRLPVRAPVR